MTQEQTPGQFPHDDRANLSPRYVLLLAGIALLVLLVGSLLRPDTALRTPSGRRLGEAAMLVSPAAWWQGFARGVPKISPGSLNGG